MGFDEGRIILDNDTGTYNVGETITGRLVFDQRNPVGIQGIYVNCIGFCKVHWTTTKTRKEGDRKVKDVIDHNAYEEYINRKIYIFGDSNGTYQLEPGHHEYRFECPIPGSCPSSFEGAHGHIRYQVKVVMVISKATSKEKLSAVRVHAPVDLNQNLYCKEPIEFKLLSSYCCCCLSSGSSLVKVKVPYGGYCPGQTIPVNISIDNPSSIEIRSLRTFITKTITYKATCEEGSTTESNVVCGGYVKNIKPGTKRGGITELEVPEMDIYNLNACRFIDVSYTFNVTTEASGCHDDNEEKHPIILGTIRLEGTEDDDGPMDPTLISRPFEVQPLQGANYYPPGPIMNQPMSNYPQTTPYPPTAYSPPPNMPYPNPVNPPYPNPLNPPYPNVSPYPPIPTYPGVPPAQAYPPPNPVPAQPTSNTNVTVTLNVPTATK